MCGQRSSFVLRQLHGSFSAGACADGCDRQCTGSQHGTVLAHHTVKRQSLLQGVVCGDSHEAGLFGGDDGGARVPGGS